MSVPDPATTDWVPLATLGGGGVDYKGAWAAGTAYIQGDVVRHNGVDYIAVNPSTGQTPTPVAAAVSPWTTGDTKVSAQAASHDDPAGGRWLISDGAAIPAQYSALIALLGPNLPDAKGRGLVMRGTHADVDAIGDNDGVALASRSPKHKSSVTDPTHGHPGSTFPTAAGTSSAPISRVADLPRDSLTAYQALTIVAAATGVTVGPAASAMIDTGSYVVVGNLFYHT